MAKGKEPVVIKEEIQVHRHPAHVIFLMIAAGLIALFFGGEWTVNGAISFARFLGISEYVISATIIAVGTSLPELVTSVRAAMKKQADVVVGNVIGSNIFNIFFVLGVTSLIRPILIPVKIIPDIFFLFFATSLLFVYVYLEKDHTLKKPMGASHVGFYALYIIILLLRG